MTSAHAVVDIQQIAGPDARRHDAGGGRHQRHRRERERAGGTVTVDRARLLQLRQQLDALLAALNRR